jgi:mono/diheme cytochrome c family protein
MMLANQTPELNPPAVGLDFESTAFPTVSILGTDGTFVTRMTSQSSNSPSAGQFGDVVSGPHAIDFTPDGNYALVVDTNSEDVLAIDARTSRRVESNLLRPLPGHMPEGVVVTGDGAHAWVDERNTGDVVLLDLVERPDPLGVLRLTLSVDGTPISRRMSDPMPATMRLGQHLFYSANSDEYPITQNHWIACATCHVEARSDAVVWEFLAGPRDTPSNAGGVAHTGFLLHTADRSAIRDYVETINFEQGGSFSLMDASQSMLMDALTTFVNFAIPYPVPPQTDPARVAHGSEIFHRPAVACASCHAGPYFTDSGAGNTMLDLSGTVLLHDVGTCDTAMRIVQGTNMVFGDVAHTAAGGQARAACMFDTPTLRGIADSAPYFHDGSAATLHDVLENTRGRMGDISSLSAQDEADLIEYLRSL